MNWCIIALAVALAYPALSFSVPRDQSPINCAGCAAHGGGSDTGDDQDPLGYYQISVNLVGSIEPGACISKQAPLMGCEEDEGCPFTLKVYYTSNIPVDVGLSGDLLNPFTWIPNKPPSATPKLAGQGSNQLDRIEIE